MFIPQMEILRMIKVKNIIACLLFFTFTYIQLDGSNAAAKGELEDILVKCKMTNYIVIWEHRIIDDWSKRETSKDIKRFDNFQFLVKKDRIEFQKDSFFSGHKYDYLEFRRFEDGYIDIIGVDYEEGFAVDTIAFWHGTYQASGILMFTRTNSRSNLSFSAECKKAKVG